MSNGMMTKCAVVAITASYLENFGLNSHSVYGLFLPESSGDIRYSVQAQTVPEISPSSILSTFFQFVGYIYI